MTDQADAPVVVPAEGRPTEEERVYKLLDSLLQWPVEVRVLEICDVLTADLTAMRLRAERAEQELADAHKRLDEAAVPRHDAMGELTVCGRLDELYGMFNTDKASALAATEAQVQRLTAAIQQLRQIMVDFKDGTQAEPPRNGPGKHQRAAERREVDTIHKTLNVVIGKIDELVASLASPEGRT